jgi:hypothetical protein
MSIPLTEDPIWMEKNTTTSRHVHGIAPVIGQWDGIPLKQTPANCFKSYMAPRPHTDFYNKLQPLCRSIPPRTAEEEEKFRILLRNNEIHINEYIGIEFGATPLIVAIIADDISAVTTIIEMKGVDINKPCVYEPFIGCTPLHFAARSTAVHSVDIFNLICGKAEISSKFTGRVVAPMKNTTLQGLALEMFGRKPECYGFTTLGLISLTKSEYGIDNIEFDDNNPPAIKGVFTLLHMLCTCPRWGTTTDSCEERNIHKALSLFKCIDKINDVDEKKLIYNYLFTKQDEQGENVLLKSLLLDNVDFATLIIEKARSDDCIDAVDLGNSLEYKKTGKNNFCNTRMNDLLGSFKKRAKQGSQTTSTDIHYIRAHSKLYYDKLNYQLSDILDLEVNDQLIEILNSHQSVGLHIKKYVELGQFCYIKRIIRVASMADYQCLGEFAQCVPEVVQAVVQNVKKSKGTTPVVVNAILVPTTVAQSIAVRIQTLKLNSESYWTRVHEISDKFEKLFKRDKKRSRNSSEL